MHCFFLFILFVDKRKKNIFLIQIKSYQLVSIFISFWGHPGAILANSGYQSPQPVKSLPQTMTFVVYVWFVLLLKQHFREERLIWREIQDISTKITLVWHKATIVRRIKKLVNLSLVWLVSGTQWESNFKFNKKKFAC